MCVCFFCVAVVRAFQFVKKTTTALGWYRFTPCSATADGLCVQQDIIFAFGVSELKREREKLKCQLYHKHALWFEGKKVLAVGAR